nr:suppressor protein SRP40-like [Labrus bergylta]
MKVTIIIFFLIGTIFANPTESLSVSQSSENDTSELMSSEENISSQSQSSESQSLESTSEDTTSEESNSLSEEDDETDSLAETRDDSMGSEENVRKSWVRVFASVIKILSGEDNSSSTEAKGPSIDHTEKQPTHTSTGTTFKQRTNMAQGHTDLQTTTDSSDTTSDSTDSSNDTGETAATSDSSESNSRESNETDETSEDSDSSELKQLRDCVNGTQSCESEEYFFQDIGDDAHYSVDNLMVPDDNEREFILRR